MTPTSRNEEKEVPPVGTESSRLLDLAPPKPWRRFIPAWLRAIIWIDSVPRYDAFLSYSWKSDLVIAPVIQSVIQRFHCPWYRTRSKTVFRDLSCLPAGSSIEAELFDRLDRSEHFIVLASDQATNSRGMELEASYWYSRPRSGQVLIIVTQPGYATWENVSAELLPPSIQHSLLAEPLWVNLGHRRDEILATPRSHKLHGTLVEDLKQILLRFYPTRNWEQLRGEEHAQRRRMIALVSTVAALFMVLAVTAVGFLVYARQERNEAVAKSKMAEVRQLAAQAQYLHTRPNQLMLSSLLGLESLIREPTTENRTFVASAASSISLHRWSIPKASYVMAISPDSKWLAAGIDNFVDVWDATGHERARLPYPASIETLAFAPDSSWLAAASRDGTIVSWEIPSGQARVRLNSAGHCPNIAISPDAKSIVGVSSGCAVSSDFDFGDYHSGMMIWDASTGIARITNPEERAHKVAFSPDGKWFITAGNWSISAWDSSTGKRRARLPSQNYIDPFTLSPDGYWFVTFRDGVGTEIWSTDSFRQLVRLPIEMIVGSVAVSPDSKWLATGTDEGSVILWDTSTWKERERLKHEGPVKALAFSPSSRWLVSGAYDNTVRIWDIDTGRQLQQLEHETDVNHIVISPDGTWLASACFDLSPIGAAIHVWRPTLGRSSMRLDNGAPITASAISFDLRFIATGGEDGNVRLWDTNTGRQQALFREKGTINNLSFSRDSSLLATASADGTARVWNIVAGREISHFEHESTVDFVTISPNNRLLGSISGDGKSSNTGTNLTLWDITTLQRRTSLDLPDISSVILTKDSAVISFGPMANSKIMIIRSSDPQQLELKQPYIITNTVITPDGKALIVASENLVRSFLRIWDPGVGKERARLDYEGIINAIATSADGTSFVTASKDRTARLFDIRTGQQRAIFEHQASVDRAVFSSDGKWLATASADDTARIWDLAGHEMLRLQFEEAVTPLAFTRDSHLLIVAHGDTVTFEAWNTADLIQDLCGRMTRNLTRIEWKQYIGDEIYRRTCLNLPASN